MNIKSIRFRLTVLYSSTLVFSLAILFVSFYWVTKRELYNHTDAILQSHAMRITNVLMSENIRLGQLMSTQALEEVFSETPGMLVFIADNDGNIFSLSQDIGNFKNKILDLLRIVKNFDVPAYINSSIGSIDMRFILLPINLENSTNTTVIIGHPIDVVEKSLHGLYASLFIVFLIFVIPTIIGGYLLAGSALLSVTNMSKEMQEISSENLSRRIMMPQTHDEIENLASVFNNLLDRLEEAFMRERQFIADVAHELKTPIASLRARIDVALSKKRSTEEYGNVLHELMIDTSKISNTLSDLLDFAYTQTDSYENIKDATNLSDIMQEIIEITQKLTYGKTIVLTSHIDDNVIVRGKKEKLFRAILNIADNAVKYCNIKGNVSIILKNDKEKALVKIKNTGRGISKEDLPHIFDRFFRGSKTDKTVGTGLGLSIAKAIIDSCGGTIQVDSTAGKGTMAVIIFPLEKFIKSS